MKEAKTVVLSTALGLLVWAGIAQAAPRVRVSIPEFIYRDLVVAGKVIKGDEPVPKTLGLPGQEKEATGVMRKFQVEVSEVFKDAGGTVKTSLPDGHKSTIDVWTKAPSRQGPAMPGENYVSLQEGNAYVLFLVPTKEKGSFLLYSDMSMTRCQPMTDALVAKVRKIADISKWPWGPEQDGLQVALFGPDAPTKLQPQGAATRGTEVLYGFLVAVRNTSTNPIALQLDSSKTTLALQGTGPNGGSAVHHAFGNPRTPGHPALTVEPGQIAFLNPSGLVGGRVVTSFASLSKGQWTFRFTCSVEAPGDAGTKQAWHGSVQSAPVEVEVEE